MADQQVHLGTIFTGKISSAFSKATADVKRAIKGIAATQTKASKVTEKATKSVKQQAKANDELTKHIKSQKSAFKKLTQGTQEQTKSYKDLTTRAVRVVAVYGGLAMVMSTITDAFTGGIQAIIDYDQALKNLQAITGATDTQVEGLGDSMRQVAADTKYSISEMAEGMILLGQAGFDSKEAMEGMEAVAVLATGTLSDMQNSTDLLTTAIRAFGLTTSDSMKVADIFASAVNKSKLTIDKLRTSFNYIGPAAHKAGLSLEETAASTMVLANSGLRASTIGTGLRQVIARLVAPNDKLREAYDAQGINLEKLNPLTNDFADIIEELTRIVPTAQKAFELFGLRGASAVSALTEAGKAGFEDMLKQVYRSNVAFEMAEKQMEGLGVKTKNLKDRMGILAVAIGRAGVDGALTDLVETLRQAVGGLIEFVESPVGKVLVWATMIATLTAAITGLVIGIKIASAAIMEFIIMRGVFAPKVLAMIVVLVALAAAYRALYRDVDQSLKQHRELFMSYTSLGEAINKYNKEIEKVNKESLDAIRLNEDLKRTMNKLVKEEGDMSEEAQKVVDTFDALGEATEETYTALQKFEDLRIKKEFQELSGITEDLIEKQKRAHNKLYKFAGVFDSLKNIVSFCTGDFKAFNKQIEKNEKGLDKSTRALKLHAREIINAILKLNKISLFASIEEFEKLATAMGIPEKELKKVLPHIESTLNELQTIARKGANRINDELLRGIDPSLVTRELKKVQPVLEKEWNNINKTTKNLTDGQLKIFKKYWYILSNDARSNLTGLVSIYDARFDDIENRGLDHNVKMEMITKTLAQAEFDVEKIKAKDISTARAAQYEGQQEALENELEHELTIIEASYDQRLSSVEKGSAQEQSLISKLAVDRLKIIDDNYKLQLDRAMKHYGDMLLLAGDNKDKQNAAIQEINTFEKNITDERITAYREMYNSFVDTTQSATDKEKEIREKLVEIEKKRSEEREKYAKQIYDYEIDLVDKVNSIKKKGLKGVAKERFIENEAINKLNVGYKNLENAIKNKDALALHGAKKLLEQSSNIFSGLKDHKLAIYGITKANEGLRRIEKANHEKKLTELDKEKKEKTLQLNLIRLQVKTYKMLYQVLAKIINQATGADEELKNQLEEAPNTSSVTDAIKDIENSIEDLKTISSETDLSMDSNFDEVSEEAGKAKTAIDEFNDLQIKKVLIEFTGEGSTERPISEKIAEVHDWISGLNDYIDRTAPVVNIDVNMTIVENAIAFLNNLVTNSLHIINPDASAVYNVLRDLERTTHSTHIVHVQEVQGKKDGGLISRFAKGGWNRLRGLLGGFGGGDRNKALLEDGEFIVRKEAVRAVGPALLNSFNNMNFAGIGEVVSGALNGSVAKMAGGGIVGNQSQEERMYNFNLDLGGTSLKGKATSSTLDAFQRDLRRLELSRGIS